MDGSKVDRGARDGGELHPAKLCTKTGERVMEVLRTKHPDARPSNESSLDMYLDRSPELAPVDITNNMVKEVSGWLSEWAGTGGADSVILQHWLLHFRIASRELRLIAADFAEWLGKRRPLWSSYQAMMSGRMIAW